MINIFIFRCGDPKSLDSYFAGRPTQNKKLTCLRLNKNFYYEEAVNFFDYLNGVFLFG